MWPELGNFALILALCFALVQSTLPFIGAAMDRPAWMQLGRRAAIGQTFFLLIAFFILDHAFIINDFSVRYVAENSSVHLPLFYRITALWGGHEGSLLLWVTILGLWSSAVACFSRTLPLIFVARVLGFMGLISVGFLGFLLSTSNPFTRLLPNIPTDGQGLNALLQDPGLALHPPTLYMGYVGFSVAFAFAMAALVTGKMDATWARWTRPWTLIAWCFLTLGITAGSLWSYRELGWGGWWFWDPVENASFMPWLAGTALLHSLIVSEKRQTFYSWTILLAICAFSLSLLGTFLVRSGILISVHAFAMDPTRGVFLLKFLLVVVGGALLLFAVRAPVLSKSSLFHFFSRETFLLLNNVLLLVAMATILLGTLYPLILDAMHLGKISVGPPYFNRLFVPLVMAALFCMGIGPLCQWQKTQGKSLKKFFIGSAIISIIIGMMMPWLIVKSMPWYVPMALPLCVWAMLAVIYSAWRQRHHFRLSKMGMWFAHVGVAVVVIGVTLSQAYSVERNVRMSPGETAQVGPYTFELLQIRGIQGSNYTGAAGNFLVTRDNQFVTWMQAQNRVYTHQQMALAKTAIDVGIFRDLYVGMAQPLDNNSWSVRLYYKPFIRWIWGGGILIFIGGLCAIVDKRKKPCPNNV